MNLLVSMLIEQRRAEVPPAAAQSSLEALKHEVQRLKEQVAQWSAPDSGGHQLHSLVQSNASFAE